MHPTWTEQLPETLRTDENYIIFDKYDKLGDFTTDYLKVNGDMSALTGERDDFKGKVTTLTDKLNSMVAIPTEESDEEEKKAFYSKLGVPESIDDYGIEVLSGDEQGKTVLENFKKANLSKAQATQMTTFLSSYSEQQLTAKQKASEVAVQTYKTSLGETADIAFKNATDAVGHFFPEGDKEAAVATIMSDPKQIAVFSRIGTLLKERPGIFASSKASKGSGKGPYASMEGLD